MVDRPPRHRRRGAAAFTFLEVMVVMAVMGILMALGVGYLQNIGRGSHASQALAIVQETAYACIQSSHGGTRAVFELRADPSGREDRLRIGAAVARPVLTHHFESLRRTSHDYPVADDNGQIEVVADGYLGRAAHFRRGGRITFYPQSAFAVTDGLDLRVWLRPDPAAAGTEMTVVRGGDGVYEVALVASGTSGGYDVRLTLKLREGELRAPAETAVHRTEGGPVRADGRWTHLHVAYNGLDPSVRVDGIERLAERTRRARIVTADAEGETEETRRIVVPEGGVASLALGPYTGLMDALVLSGVFRSSDTDRQLRGLSLVSHKLPLGVVFRNGRLDPDENDDHVLLVFQEVARPEARPIRIRLNRDGTVERLRETWRRSGGGS